MSNVSLLFVVLCVGDTGLGLIGVAAYHGLVSATSGALIALGGAVLHGRVRRAVFRWFDRRHSGAARRASSGLLWHWLRAGGHALLVPSLGYAWAYALGSVWGPTFGSGRLVAGALLVALTAWVLWGTIKSQAHSLVYWPTTARIRPQPNAAHLIWLAVAPFWMTDSEGVAVVLQRNAPRGLQFDASSVRWVDVPYRGVRTAFSTARALVLGAQAGDLRDVYLVRVGLSCDGAVVRLDGVYNLTQTSATDESEPLIWRKWAAWAVGEPSAVRSIEVADLRGEPAGFGAGWTDLKRLQRGLTNLQLTGQYRGVRRSQLSFVAPTPVEAIRLDGGSVDVVLEKRTIRLELGKQPSPETLGSATAFQTADVPLPGAFVPWAVDRLRAVSWIGSDRMQWLKGVAFRASGQLEDLEHVVVGIDPDEAIADQIGSMEELPVATAGDVPGWPPAPIPAVLARPLTGEGKWVNVAGDLLASELAGESSPFVFSFIRTDPSRPYIQTSIVLWDPRRVQLHIVAGTEEPKSATGELGSGLIPRDPQVLKRVVGAFNGAFQAVHGAFGMMENRHVQLPPKPYAATVATYADGQAGLGTWPPNTVIPADMLSLRQNLTPLVVGSDYNPYQRAWWGGVPVGWTEETRTVRSGLCLTSEGYLAYFYSLGTDPQGLGRAMLQARCTYGIHLDMNAGNAGFEFYRVAAKAQLPSLGRPLDRAWEATGSVDGAPGLAFVSRMLVRKMPFDFPRYLRLNARDFFYLTLRDVLPGRALTPLLSGQPGDGQWKVIDTGDAWPAAVAMAEFHDGAAADSKPVSRVTRIDPQTLLTVPERGQASFGLLWVQHAGPAPIALGGDRQFLVQGQPARELRSACLDSRGMLVLLDPPVPAQRNAAWSAIVPQLNCVTAIDSAGVARVVLARDGGTVRTLPESTPITWFAHRPLPGARPIFEQTPIVPPNDWAYLQQKAVPYTAPAPR